MPGFGPQCGFPMRALVLCLLFIVGHSVGQAQDLKKVSCRFLSLDRDAPPPPLLNIADKGDVACAVTTDSLSPPTVCYAKGGVISFVAAADHKPAATATVPANVSAAMLIFIPAAKDPKNPNALAWRVFVIEDSVKNFPDGGVFVANFHNQDIRFSIGGGKFMLHSAGCHGFPMPAQLNNFNMAPVVFEFMQKDKWETARETMLRFLPGMRYLMFAYLDPASERPRIVTYRDFETGKVAPPPPKSAPGKPAAPK